MFGAFSCRSWASLTATIMLFNTLLTNGKWFLLLCWIKYLTTCIRSLIVEFKFFEISKINAEFSYFSIFFMNKILEIYIKTFIVLLNHWKIVCCPHVRLNVVKNLIDR